MNKRQKKKKDRFSQLCVEYGYHYVPTYKELRELERAYHEFCINNYRVERAIDKIIANRFVTLS